MPPSAPGGYGGAAVMSRRVAVAAWQKAEAPLLTVAGLVSIWREMIGMALAQQGGITIRASQDTMPHAREHFGASLDYETAAPRLDDLVDNPRLVAVLSLGEATAPPTGVTVFARLPLVGAPQALCYSATGPEDGHGHEGAVSLVCRSQALAGDHVLFTGADYTLSETTGGRVGDGCIWGHYLTLGAVA